MGGIGVILGFYVGVGILAALVVPADSSALFFAALSACLGAGVVGLMDDMFRLRKRSKAVLPFILALPLGAVVYSAKNTVLLGLDIGILMVLVVPLGMTSAANAANMLEGFNGLGAGLGVIMCLTMLGLAFLTGDLAGMYLVLPLLGALTAFLCFNRYPARIFPGDSMTLFMGATIAAAAIIARQKTYGALLFIPFIVEFALKARGRFRAENYGSLDSQGNLSYDGPIQSLSHALMRWRRLSEWK